MSAADIDRAYARGSGRLMAHCAAFGDVERLPVIDRLRQSIGTELTRLLLLALAGDHRMRSRDRAA